MIAIENHAGREVWHIVRPSRYDKGYAEDAPPTAILVGTLALFAVPGIILGGAYAGEVHEELWPAVIALTVLFLLGVAYTLGLMLTAERRWQEREVDASELSFPSGPAQSGPEAVQPMSGTQSVTDAQ
jgi:hypothetical protein